MQQHINQSLEAEKFLIVDTPLEDVHTFSLLAGASLLDARILKEHLRAMMWGALMSCDPRETIVIVPGEGAQMLADIAAEHAFEQKSIYASRWWVPGSDPIARAGRVYESFRINPDITNVIVLDDVQSSGATLAAIHRANAWQFPRAEWSAGVLVSQSMGLKRRRRIAAHYRDFYCPIVVNSNRGKQNVPINSLSNLVKDVELAANYVRRNVALSKRGECFQILGHDESFKACR